jgi:hypothetical protein
MKSFILLFVTLLTLSSCQLYTSDVPITDSSKSTIDNALLGKWYIAEPDSSGKAVMPSTNSYTVYDFNGKEYAVLCTGMNENNTAAEDNILLKAHNSKIGNLNFLNFIPAYPQKPEEAEKYTFALIKQNNPDSFSIQFLTDSLKESFNSSKAFSSFLKKNLNKLEQQWLTKPQTLYKLSYFNWDRTNVNKLSELTEVWKIEAINLSLTSKIEDLLKLPKKMMDIQKFSTDLSLSAYTKTQKSSIFNDGYELYILKYKNGVQELVGISSEEDNIILTDLKGRKFKMPVNSN